MRRLLFKTCLAISVLTPTAWGAQTPNFEVIAEIPVKKPAFIFIDKETPDAEANLLVTSFSPFFGGHRVSLFSQLEKIVHGGTATENQKILTTESTWPNEATRAPEEMFGPDHFIVSGGFLVPGSDKGAVDLVHLEKGKIRSLTKTKGGWFYHRSRFIDMNADGKLDILTARAKKSLFGSGGEMLWLEQPENINDSWKEHVILEGPDVHFRLFDFDRDGTMEIIATQFFSKKLSIHWLEDGKWQTDIIDDQLGSAFDVEVTDLNLDGRVDLLVTNHEKNDNAAVFAYIQPETKITGKWERKTLYTGMRPLSGFNAMAPGEAFAFHPSESRKNKPWIMVSGDGTQKAHLLVPKTEATSNWKYEHYEIANGKGTVGKISVEDIDGDGWVEAFIPAYDKDKIIVVGFKP